MNNEQWADITGTDGKYQVSTHGRVRRDGEVLHLSITLGYPIIAIRRNGEHKTRAVHRLVAEAFLGPRPDGHVVHHKDQDRGNNHIENLEYLTISEHWRLHRFERRKSLVPGVDEAIPELGQVPPHEPRVTDEQLRALGFTVPT